MAIEYAAYLKAGRGLKVFWVFFMEGSEAEFSEMDTNQPGQSQPEQSHMQDPQLDQDPAAAAQLFNLLGLLMWI